jgi:hypothetical protein
MAHGRHVRRVEGLESSRSSLVWASVVHVRLRAEYWAYVVHVRLRAEYWAYVVHVWRRG